MAVDIRDIFSHNKFMIFRKNDWNVEHIAGHGVSLEEAQMVIRAARSPFPKRIEEDKWLVWNRRRGGRFLQVVFVLDQDETIYVIHARRLTEQEQRQYRRRN